MELWMDIDVILVSNLFMELWADTDVRSFGLFMELCADTDVMSFGNVSDKRYTPTWKLNGEVELRMNQG